MPAKEQPYSERTEALKTSGCAWPLASQMSNDMTSEIRGLLGLSPVKENHDVGPPSLNRRKVRPAFLPPCNRRQPSDRPSLRTYAAGGQRPSPSPGSYGYKQALRGCSARRLPQRRNRGIRESDRAPALL